MSKEKQSEQIDLIREIYKSGLAEINGREYHFSASTHKKRLKVFAFLSRVQGDMQAGDFSFLDTPQWESIELVISSMITFDGNVLSKIKEHFEAFPADYLKLFTTAMAVIALPLSDESLTD